LLTIFRVVGLPLRTLRAMQIRSTDANATIEDVGWEMFKLLLEVASGRKTWAEHWKLTNTLTLFNPAPVT
jgi:galactarate dehydratase